LFWRRVALAPICLLLVAGLHVARVAWCGQSAWKGGGFGMFSTVDAPNARFVRAYLVRGQHRVAISVPDKLSKVQSELRTAPSQTRLDELATELARQSWIDEDARWQTIAGKLPSQTADSPLAAALLRNRRGQESQPPTPAIAGSKSNIVAAGSIDQRRERGDLLAIDGVVIELWRYEYDAPANVLRARLLLTAAADSTESP
jgi:hypothetical protein